MKHIILHILKTSLVTFFYIAQLQILSISELVVNYNLIFEIFGCKSI
jgi:hypothetical protein